MWNWPLSRCCAYPQPQHVHARGRMGRVSLAIQGFPAFPIKGGEQLSKPFSRAHTLKLPSQPNFKKVRLEYAGTFPGVQFFPSSACSFCLITFQILLWAVVDFTSFPFGLRAPSCVTETQRAWGGVRGVPEQGAPCGQRAGGPWAARDCGLARTPCGRRLRDDL